MIRGGYSGHEMSISEIARELGWTEEAVKMALRRGVARLRRRPQLLARMRELVEARRQLLDARAIRED